MLSKKASRQHEVILRVGGEGGGYTIWGERHHGHWRFWRDPDCGDSWMYDDDSDAAVPASTEPTPVPRISYFDNLEDALGQINSGWPLLYPIQVHPDFGGDIWNRVVVYLRNDRSRRKNDMLVRWREHCLGGAFNATEPATKR